MEKYYVSKDTRFVASHELSVSNAIVEKEKDNVVAIINILGRWLKQILPNAQYVVYCKGDDLNVDSLVLYNVNDPKDTTRMNIVHTKFNVRFQIGWYKTEYNIEKAQ